MLVVKLEDEHQNEGLQGKGIIMNRIVVIYRMNHMFLHATG